MKNKKNLIGLVIVLAALAVIWALRIYFTMPKLPQPKQEKNHEYIIEVDTPNLPDAIDELGWK